MVGHVAEGETNGMGMVVFIMVLLSFFVVADAFGRVPQRRGCSLGVVGWPPCGVAHLASQKPGSLIS